MPRKIPEGRFSDLVRAATDVFITQGYRRTQMADVAAALGVAKGTLYGYVESKEALFHLAALHADDPDPPTLPEELPVPTPAPGETVRSLRERLIPRARLPLLDAALERERVGDVRGELEAILREMYAVQRRLHRSLKLIDRCALDHPELRAEWEKRGRTHVQGRLSRYLEARIESGQVGAVPDPWVAARFVIEAIATWTMHIRWDPFPQGLDEAVAEETVIRFLLGGLLKEKP